MILSSAARADHARIAMECDFRFVLRSCLATSHNKMVKNNSPAEASAEERVPSSRERVACVASVSFWFWGKKRLWKGIFGFDRARNETRTKKLKRREGEGKEGNLPSFLPPPLPALLLAPFFARSLTLVPHSLLLKLIETLATQARERARTMEMSL